MTPGLYTRAKEVFFAICDLPADERAARLEERCAGAPDVRAAVLQLLDGDASAVGLENAACGARDHFDDLLAPPDVEPLPRSPTTTCSSRSAKAVSASSSAPSSSFP